MAQVESFCVINTHTDPHTLTSSPSHPHPHIFTYLHTGCDTAANGTSGAAEGRENPGV